MATRVPEGEGTSMNMEKHGGSVTDTVNPDILVTAQGGDVNPTPTLHAATGDENETSCATAVVDESSVTKSLQGDLSSGHQLLTTSNNQQQSYNVDDQKKPVRFTNSDDSEYEVENESTPLLANNQQNSSSGFPNSSKMGVRKDVSEISPMVYVLVILFAISSWIDINGLWVEVPLLVNSLPESWNLPSYLAIIIQVANIGPIIYTVSNMLAPHRVKEGPAVYIIVIIGAAACLLLAFFWDYTSYLVGSIHSTALIILTGFLALVDCTSSVVYLPYMAQFKPQYMTAFYIGEGLSGLLPGLLGLIQGVGSEPRCVNETVVTNHTTNSTEFVITPVYDAPRFGVEGFFYFLFAMVCVSGISFTLLHYTAFCKHEHCKPRVKKIEVTEKYDTQGENINHEHLNQLSIEESAESSDPLTVSIEHTSQKPPQKLTKIQFIMLILVTAWINALQNGVLPSTQSYSCLPYGNLAYTLAVRLSTVANPLLCFLALFVPTRSLRVVGMLTLITTVMATYQLYLAAMSPSPPLEDQTAGVVIVILTQLLFTSSVSYMKVINAYILNDHGGSRALLWCGVATQTGSCIGAVIAFILVNTLHLFHSEPACS